MSDNLAYSGKFDYSAEMAECRAVFAKSFHSSNGWKIMNRYNWRSCIADFVVLRQLDNYITQKFLVEVNFEETPKIADINKFRTFIQASNKEGSIILGKFMISPAGSLEASLPDRINYLSLESFKKDGLSVEISDEFVLVA